MHITTLKRCVSITILSFLCLVADFSTSVLAQQEDGQAGILLTPTRLILEGRNRSASVSLANNGDATGTYRIEFINKRMTQDGRFETIEEPMPEDMTAASFLRISPRRVTLEPGQHQSIRILARKPANLPEGEYRSHLRFTIVPQAKTLKEQEQDENQELAISIRANFGISIPLIVRHGVLSVKSDINNFSLSKEPETNKQLLDFTINRDGGKSLYGDLDVIYTPASGSKITVKSMGGIAVYTPNTKRNFSIPLDIPDGTTLNGGSISVIYKEKEDDGGALLAKGTLGL